MVERDIFFPRASIFRYVRESIKVMKKCNRVNLTPFANKVLGFREKFTSLDIIHNFRLEYNIEKNIYGI